jgi:O-acetyl-ADP-ribose deacetylase (regulator of RNase III)
MNNKRFHTVLFIFLVATITLKSSAPETQLSCPESIQFVTILSDNAIKSIYRFRRLLEFRKGYDTEVANVDCFVYGANEKLLQGGGTATYPFDACGQELKNYINDSFTSNPKCPTGDAKITPAYGELLKKNIKYIIHAVAPDAHIFLNLADQKKLLKSAYTKSLILASENNAKSIYFPLLGAGIYAIKKNNACIWALEAILEFFRNNHSSLEKILFVFWKDEPTDPAYDIFSEIIDSSLEPLQKSRYILDYYRIIKTIKSKESTSDIGGALPSLKISEPERHNTRMFNASSTVSEPIRNFPPSSFSFLTRIKSMFSYLFPRSLLQKIYINFWKKKEQLNSSTGTNDNDTVPLNMAPQKK